MIFGIYRDYNKDVKFLSFILFFYQLLTNNNLVLTYCMVKFLNVKIRSIPVERGFYLISVMASIFYILFTILVLITFSWRLKSIDDALMETTSNEKKKLLRKLKIILRMWSKVDDVISSISRLFIISNIFYLLNFLIFVLILLFLGYDIYVHNLGGDDKLLFGFASFFSITIISFISVLIIQSQNICEKVTNAIRKINLIKLKSKEKNIQKYCHLATLQLEVSNKFISCRLFDLNYKFIFTMISSCFSYLVMMVQFDYMLKENQFKILSAATD